MTDKQAFLAYVNANAGRADFKPENIRDVVAKLERYVADGKAERYQAQLAEARAVLRFLEAE